MARYRLCQFQISDKDEPVFLRQMSYKVLSIVNILFLLGIHFDSINFHSSLNFVSAQTDLDIEPIAIIVDPNK